MPDCKALTTYNAALKFEFEQSKKHWGEQSMSDNNKELTNYDATISFSAEINTPEPPPRVYNAVFAIVSKRFGWATTQQIFVDRALRISLCAIFITCGEGTVNAVCAALFELLKKYTNDAVEQALLSSIGLDINPIRTGRISSTPARPFLKPAIDLAVKDAVKTFTNAIKKGVDDDRA